MNKRLLLACLALAVLYFPNEARAQFNDARAYENTPVGTNQLELRYAYVYARGARACQRFGDLLPRLKAGGFSHNACPYFRLR